MKVNVRHLKYKCAILFSGYVEKLMDVISYLNPLKKLTRTTCTSNEEGLEKVKNTSLNKINESIIYIILVVLEYWDLIQVILASER